MECVIELLYQLKEEGGQRSGYTPSEEEGLSG